MEAAARRLLAEWDERIAKKKAAERLEASAQIADPARSLLEKAADSETGLGFDRCPPVSAAGGVYDGFVAGEVECAGPVEPDDVPMRSPASNADSNRHLLTTGRGRAVRWENSD